MSFYTNELDRMKSAMGAMTTSMAPLLWKPNLETEDYLDELEAIFKVDLYLIDANEDEGICILGDYICTSFSRSINEFIENRIRRMEVGRSQKIKQEIEEQWAKSEREDDYITLFDLIVDLFSECFSYSAIHIPKTHNKRNHQTIHFLLTLLYTFMGKILDTENICRQNTSLRKNHIPNGYVSVHLAQTTARLVIMPQEAIERTNLINSLLTSTRELKKWSDANNVITTELLKVILDIVPNKFVRYQTHYTQFEFKEDRWGVSFIYDVDINGFGLCEDISYRVTLRKSLKDGFDFFSRQLAERQNATIDSHLFEDLGTMLNFRILGRISRKNSLVIGASVISIKSQQTQFKPPKYLN